MMCQKCHQISGWLFLIFGVLFLLRDLNLWDVFGIQAWTVLFLIVGMAFVAMSKCRDCMSMMPKKK